MKRGAVPSWDTFQWTMCEEFSLMRPYGGQNVETCSLGWPKDPQWSPFIEKMQYSLILAAPAGNWACMPTILIFTRYFLKFTKDLHSWSNTRVILLLFLFLKSPQNDVNNISESPVFLGEDAQHPHFSSLFPVFKSVMDDIILMIHSFLTLARLLWNISEIRFLRLICIAL